MLADEHVRLQEAKVKFLAYLATKELTDIKLELVNIRCGHRTHSNLAGEEDFENHMRNSHWVKIQSLRPVFTRSADCKVWIN